MGTNIQLVPAKSAQTHPFVQNGLSKGRPYFRTALQGEDLDCAGSECVAALRCHDHVAVAHDAHFQWHTHGRFVARLVGLDDGIPPCLLYDGVVWFRAVVTLGWELYVDVSV